MSERWKPKEGEAYYFFNSASNIESELYEDNYFWDKGRIEMGNCFKTEAEAEAAAEKVKALLLSLHDNGTSTDSETLKDTFTEYLKKCSEIQADMILQKAKEHRLSEQYGNAPEETKLPDWCKVGATGWHKRCGYFKVTYIDDFSKHVNIQQVEDNSKGFLHFHTVCTECAEARHCPYNADEMKALVGKVIEDPQNRMMQIIAYEDNKVVTLLKSYTASDLISDNITIDGKPAGVLEHLDDKGEWVK